MYTRVHTSSTGTYKAANGPVLKKVCEEVGDKTTYRNITIRNTENLRTSFAKEKENYLHKLESNLHKRFDAESLCILEHLDLILNPTRLDTTTRGLPVYGEDSLTHVLDFYIWKESTS